MVEMLVSIMIIALLAAMLFPSIQKVRNSGGQARCSANLRSLIQGWSLYCSDHDGGSVIYGINEDPSGKYGGWISQILSYLGSGNIDRLLLCPVAKTTTESGVRGTSKNAWKYSAMVGSYGLNARWYRYTDGSSAEYDSPTPNYYKKQLNGKTKEGPVISDAVWVDFDRGPGPPADFETAVGSGAYAIVRHGGKGVNMAFADGSVRLVSMGEVFSSLKLRPIEVINPGWIHAVPEKYR